MSRGTEYTVSEDPTRIKRLSPELIVRYTNLW
jgi:hypothetical protein